MYRIKFCCYPELSKHGFARGFEDFRRADGAGFVFQCAKNVPTARYDIG